MCEFVKAGKIGILHHFKQSKTSQHQPPKSPYWIHIGLLPFGAFLYQQTLSSKMPEEVGARFKEEIIKDRTLLVKEICVD